jgi:hypothetical protein
VGWSTFGTIAAWALALALTTPAGASAQSLTDPPMLQASSPAASQDPPQDSKTQGDQGKQKPDDQTGGKSNDRLFWVLPNFLTVKNAKDVPPLTTKQKYALVTEGSFDVVEYPWYAVLAGISQVNDSEPGFGLGWTGYAKRYGAAFADGTIENYMVGAVLPSILHEDPRYYQLGTGNVAHRIGYAVSRIFVTRTDSGHARVNFSEILGSGLAAGMANGYHPRGDRTLPNTLSVWRTMVGYDTLTTLTKEFWPDLRRLFQGRGRSAGTSSGLDH